MKRAKRKTLKTKTTVARATQTTKPVRTTQAPKAKQTKQIAKPVRTTQAPKVKQATKTTKPVQTTQASKAKQTKQTAKPVRTTQAPKTKQTTQTIKPVRTTPATKPKKTAEKAKPVRTTQKPKAKQVAIVKQEEKVAVREPAPAPVTTVSSVSRGYGDPYAAFDKKQQEAQGKATQDVIDIYTLLERQQVRLAYEHFKKNQIPLKTYVSKEVYDVLESTVLQAFKGLTEVYE